MNRSRSAAPGIVNWLLRQLKRRPKPVWFVIFMHLAAAGIALCIFALPHHVLPRSRESLNITVSRDAAPVIAQPEATAVPSADAAQADPAAAG